jgi:transcriptional regulator with XRE-family HTH domain
MIRLKVKQVAAARGLSQRQLQIRSGLDIRIIQRVMRSEKANITLTTLDKLAKALGIDASELIESVPDEPPHKKEP